MPGFPGFPDYPKFSEFLGIFRFSGLFKFRISILTIRKLTSLVHIHMMRYLKKPESRLCKRKLWFSQIKHKDAGTHAGYILFWYDTMAKFWKEWVKSCGEKWLMCPKIAKSLAFVCTENWINHPYTTNKSYFGIIRTSLDVSFTYCMGNLETYISHLCTLLYRVSR